jgi:hypothetical protein
LQKLDAWEKDESAAESKSFEEEFTDEEIYDELLDELEITNKLIH